MRITVRDVLEYLAGGMSVEEVLLDFPELTNDDIRAQVPSASDSLIRKVLHDLRDTGAVKAQSGGRGAKWRRLHRDF